MRSTNHDNDDSKENVNSIWGKSWENKGTDKCHLQQNREKTVIRAFNKISRGYLMY